MEVCIFLTLIALISHKLTQFLSCLLQLVERVLDSLQTAVGQGDSKLAIVRLSGQIHSDERTAFQEMARQLCRCIIINVFPI